MQGMSIDLSVSVQERIDGIRGQTGRILSEYRQGKNAHAFSLRDQAIGLCKSMNLLRKQTLSSRYVVVHPRNRYGDGLVPEQVYKLVDAFASHGFSLLEIGLPLASEVPPATNPRGAEAKEFNQAIVKDAQGALPPIAEEEYMIMSVAKSHSSMASRCVIFAMPHDNAMVTDNGRLSLQKTRAISPEYADAIEQGFEWNVLLWQAEEAFPPLIDLLQETGNLGQQTAMDETRWQVALKTFSSLQRLIREADADVAAGKTASTIDEIWDLSLIHI